jgi:hypothetical protein
MWYKFDRCTQLGRKLMIRALRILNMSIVVLSGTANAQGENVALPSGSMMWRYECKPGTQCPTKCSAQGKDLFETGNFVSLTIVKIANNEHWLRVDAGSSKIDYVIQSDQFTCTISGAALTSATAQQSPARP